MDTSLSWDQTQLYRNAQGCHETRRPKSDRLMLKTRLMTVPPCPENAGPGLEFNPAFSRQGGTVMVFIFDVLIISPVDDSAPLPGECRAGTGIQPGKLSKHQI